MSTSPSLSNYFGNAEDQTDKASEFNLLTNKKDEPVVCRIFADTPQLSKPVTDPTSNFFDSVMQPSSTNSEITTDSVLSSCKFEESSFTDVLGGNEVNRRRDAWIPSESTREALIASATSPTGTYVPDSSLLTMPGTILDGDLDDLFQEVVTHYLGAAEATERKILTADDVTQDDRGLQELIQANCFRAAINLTGRLLKIYCQGPGGLDRPSKHTPHSLQLWFTRITLLVRIKSFSLAEKESEAFGDLDNPDLYFQFYPDKFGGRPGSIVPFSFRLLLAELPMHCGKPRDAMTRLNKILSVVKHILSNLKQGLSEDGNPMELSETDRSESVQLWLSRQTRVQHSIINCALQQENYMLAIDITKQLIAIESNTTQKVGLHSVLGRILLQLGDIIEAEKNFNKSYMLLGQTSDIRHYVDKALIEIARNNFTEAYQILIKANKMDPANIMVLNNMAVCLLYTGRLKEAISLLENAINANPARALNESLLLNLCTLYELESSHSKEKKLNLLRQLARHKADSGMNVHQCLKLPI